jgi:hypothetical protein
MTDDILVAKGIQLVSSDEFWSWYVSYYSWAPSQAAVSLPMVHGGPPKCPPDQTQGALVEVFPVSESEGHSVGQEGIDRVLEFTVEGLDGAGETPALI